MRDVIRYGRRQSPSFRPLQWHRWSARERESIGVAVGGDGIAVAGARVDGIKVGFLAQEKLVCLCVEVCRPCASLFGRFDEPPPEGLSKSRTRAGPDIRGALP